MNIKKWSLISLIFVFSTCCCASTSNSNTVNNKVKNLPTLSMTPYYANKAYKPPSIDGDSADKAWQAAVWKPMQYVTIGDALDPEDFSGRIKVVWDSQHLYVLAEITDDVLSDMHADPLSHYWDDDCLEIFLDEDASGGPHRYSYNAFAYHIGLDNQVVDTGINKKAQLYNHHIHSRWKRYKDKIVWEVSIKVYNDKLLDGQKNATPVTLVKNKTLGFMVHYCDADGKGVREHFVGTEDIAPVNGDRNRGWLDADVFGRLILIDE